jgi:hypothetical protein
LPPSPAAWDAWSLLFNGWVNLDTAGAGSVTLSAVQASDTALILPFPGTDEYLLLENRQPLWSDTAQMGTGLPTSSLCCSVRKSPGLLIWHVDPSVIAGGIPGNDVNSHPVKGLKLIQADGLDQLQLSSGGNRGDMGDAFPGSSGRTSADATSTPALTSNNGRVAFAISAITQISPNGPISFTVSAPEFKVRAISAGNGTVTSSAAGSISAGIFVDSASVTTLTAVPGDSATFTGWSGDTSTTNPVLVLPLNRPYNVSATFTGAVAVSEPEATDAILLITPLTPSQATYLDAVGNNNGVYDLGDYLAYLKANAIVPAPGVLTRVMMHGAKPLVAPTKKEQ